MKPHTTKRHNLWQPLFWNALFALAFLLGPSAAAQAQPEISALIGYDFGGDANCSNITGCREKRLNTAVSVGVTGAVFGFEEELGYARDFFGEAPGLSSSVLTLMSNLMLVPKLGPIRPYALAGIGLIKTHVEFTPSSLLTTNQNHFGWDVGGGLIVFVAPHFGIRGDIRYFHTFQDVDLAGITLRGPKFDFGRAAAGVTVAF